MAGRRAVAAVTLDDAGGAKTIRLDLVKLRPGWRVGDIHAPSGDLRVVRRRSAVKKLEIPSA